MCESFSGTVASSFQFASSFTDAQTGLVKFGARYYDPTVARWAQQDPFVGNLANPKTLNRYAYAGCDPVNNTDPSGRQINVFNCGISVGGLVLSFLSLVILAPSGIGLFFAGWSLIASAASVATSCYEI